jgi:Na+-driven multidrug efflux pump
MTEPPRPRKPAVSFVEGPIARALVMFSLPILASSVLQSLNASINAAWIGHLLGSQALAASANANALFFFLFSVSFGLIMAATILIGQSLGAGDTGLTKRVMGTTILFFGVSSLVIAVSGFVVAPGVLHLMHTPADAAPLAAAYLRIIFMAVPAIFLFTFITGAMRGAGDSRTPFVFMLVSSTLDVVLNPLFIAGVGPFPKLGIAGSAVATAIAQWSALIYS